MKYRGYTLIRDDVGAEGVEIYGPNGALIDSASTTEAAMETIDSWLDAR